MFMELSMAANSAHLRGSAPDANIPASYMHQVLAGLAILWLIGSVCLVVFNQFRATGLQVKSSLQYDIDVNQYMTLTYW